MADEELAAVPCAVITPAQGKTALEKELGIVSEVQREAGAQGEFPGACGKVGGRESAVPAVGKPEGRSRPQVKRDGAVPLAIAQQGLPEVARPPPAVISK